MSAPTPRFEPVIGLEIHAQLLTHTKMFCGCRTTFGAPPNTQVCPTCLGLPGALPVVNRRAVEFALRAALAFGCTIRERSVFARKNYFYPDLPKGYQISQYDEPLALGGHVTTPAGVRVDLIRVHLEEDAGKSIHHGQADSDRLTYLDFNRSGVPLIEIVTEPDLRTAADAADCFAAVREILVALAVNDGNMEEGSLRCDANVSVRAKGSSTFGTKTEVKNVNSFRYVQQALEFEIARHTAVLQAGGVVTQDTRLWDSATGETAPMRTKEDAHDYRYFPEPDLAPLVVTPSWIEEVRRALPELPDATKARFAREYGLGAYEADVIVRLGHGADFFERMVRAGASPRAAANWLQGEVRRTLKEIGRDDTRAVPFTAEALAELALAVERGTISSTTGKEVFERLWAAPGTSALSIIESEGLAQVGDADALAPTISGVLASHAEVVAQYRAGKTAAFGFLVGQAMKASGGKANPKTVTALLRAALDAAPE